MKLETIALHQGYSAEGTSRSAAVPIYQTTSYTFENTQHAAELFDLKQPGNIYTRIMNPTTDVLEQRMATLEGGIAAMATASGLTAITYAIQCICLQGDNFVSSSQVYGGTSNLFSYTLPAMGIEGRLVNGDDIDAFAAAIDDKTKLIYCELIGNPKGNMVDIAALAKLAQQHHIPLIVDNTIASPFLCRPIEWGADIVIHSLTKYIGGHGNSMGGIIIDAGKFDWQANAAKFPQLNQPDPSYHGIVYTEEMQQAAYIGRCRIALLRNLGGAISPFNSFLILQGLETLGLRMQRHCENSQGLANYLMQHNKVAWLSYAGLRSSPYYSLCQKLCSGQASGVMSFGLKGGFKACQQFIDSLKLILHLVNIGDAKSLACHPASTTHRQLNQTELAEVGISQDMIRLSVGLEHIDDIIADIAQALAQVD